MELYYFFKFYFYILLIFHSVNCQSSFIISKSKNLSVELNEIVHLPCVVQQSDNTIIIWQQCEDSECNELRTPVTIGKENFIQDLRFRLLSDNLLNNKTEDDNNDEFLKQNLVNWMLEIRKFSKNDEACYACQLNKLNSNKVHYCLKVKPKLVISYKPEVVKLHHQLKLECFVDHVVHSEKLKWYKNGLRVHNNHNNVLIEKRNSNDYTFTILVIKHFRISDEGIYTCKYENISDKSVNIFTQKQKNSGFNKNQLIKNSASSSFSSKILLCYTGTILTYFYIQRKELAFTF